MSLPLRPVIIIPVHNRCATTLACLRRLRANGDFARCAVLVVDDGSTDGTGAAVQTEFPEVEILGGDGHLWWTGAIALGMIHAFARGAPAVIWLNDDCLPAAGTLDALLAQALAATFPLVAPACFMAETGQAVPNAFRGRNRVTPRAGETCEVDGLSGFCVALPRAVWSRIGPPDARRFPHYFGDNAYTLTATRAGFPAMVLGAVRADLTGFRVPLTLPLLHDPARTWRENFERAFISPKSPCRWRTLFAFQRLKYGPVAGRLLATGRAAAGVAQLLWLQVRG